MKKFTPKQKENICKVANMVNGLQKFSAADMEQGRTECCTIELHSGMVINGNTLYNIAKLLQNTSFAFMTSKTNIEIWVKEK